VGTEGRTQGARTDLPEKNLRERGTCQGAEGEDREREQGENFTHHTPPYFGLLPLVQSIRLRCDDDHKKAHFNPTDRYPFLLARKALLLTFARRLTAFPALEPQLKLSRSMLK
jgi:hypothetical protein